MNNVTVLKSLADDTRLSVVRELARANCEIACSELLTDCSRALQLSQPTMSHHFKQLVQAGVITERKVGKEKYYRLARDRLNRIGIDVDKL